MKILFLIISPKSYNHQSTMNIDRPDLTRKLDIINTWALDAHQAGHEVIFFNGGNESQYYDEQLRTLYLTEDDRYEPEAYEENPLSRIFPKIQAALRWAKDNKSFDRAYVCDDDIYVNLPEFLKLDMNYDYRGNGALGGSGFLFSAKGIEALLNFTNTHHRVADHAIYDAMVNNSGDIIKTVNTPEMAPYYVPGELQATVHYVTGKRAYFIHNLFKQYRENNLTNRKIILGGPLDVYVPNEFISYEATAKRHTMRWYDFTLDPNGWEYHGGYARSQLRFNDLLGFWPYGKGTTKYFVLGYEYVLQDYEKGSDLYKSNLNYIIKKCRESLIDENNLILCSEKEEYLEGWTVDNTVKESLKLNFELLQAYTFYTKTKI